MELMLGIATIVFAILCAPRLGWEDGPSRGKLLAAALLFVLGMVLPSFALLGNRPEQGFFVAGSIATGLGAIALVLAVLAFRRSDSA